MNRHYRELLSYIIVVIVSVSISFIIQRVVDNSQFQAPGSRFTGEDAIWLIEHSNIVITREERIQGIPTPFRDYINQRP